MNKKTAENQGLKKEKSRMKHYFFITIIGGWIIGIGSFNIINAHQNQEKNEQNQPANILIEKNDRKKMTKEKDSSEKNHDPASLILEQYDYFRRGTEPKNLNLEQLEKEVDQLVSEFVKEKNEKRESIIALSTSISKKEDTDIQPIEPEIENDSPKETPMLWREAQLIIPSSYIVVNQHSHFEPANYFDIITGTDTSPIIEHNFIDTSLLGEQTFYIQVTDSKGNVAYSEIKFLINSTPIIYLEQPVFHRHIGNSIDLLAGVSAFDHEDGDLTSKITIETNLDIHSEGVYEVTYSVVDQYNAKNTAKVIINIKNDAPIIYSPEFIEHKINHLFNIFDYIEVLDTEDGVIQLAESNIIETNFDSQKEGNYFFKIGNIKDRHGKLAEEKRIIVSVTNEAPKFIHTDMRVNVFSDLTKEEYLAQLVVSDREDPSENLVIEIDEVEWNQIDTSKLEEYLIPIKVTDTNGKATNAYGKITIINEPPVFFGVVHREIMLGEAFDPLAGIRVYDKEESLSIDDVEVTGVFDIHTPGEYTINLSIKDSFDQVTTSYQLIVLEKTEISEEKN